MKKITRNLLVLSLAVCFLTLTVKMTVGALPNQLKAARLTDSTLVADIDSQIGLLEVAITDILGIPIDTNISAAGFTFAAAGLTKVIFQAIADTTTTSGQLWRSSTTANTLKYYDGTTTRSLVDLSLTQALTGKTYNGLTVTSTTGTLTIDSGKTLRVSQGVIFDGTLDNATVNFVSGGTMVYTSSNLSAFAATTSLQLLGVISDETGSGALVFGTAPQISSIELGHASDTTLTRVSAGVVAVEGNSIATAASKLSVFAATTSAELFGVISDETGGTGVLVGSTSPAFTTNISTPAIITASGALTVTPAAGSNLDIVLSTTGDFAVNTDDIFVDTSAGFVGIGTTTVSEVLQVGGNIHLRHTGNQILRTTEAGFAARWAMGVIATGIAGQTGSDLVFRGNGATTLSDGTEYLRILNASGSVGLGTAANINQTLTFANAGTIGFVNAAANTSYQAVTMDSSDDIIYGNTTTPQRVRTSLGTPGNLGNGDWWAECSGTTPNRLCSINVQDGSATRILAQIVY